MLFGHDWHKADGIARIAAPVVFSFQDGHVTMQVAEVPSGAAMAT